MRFDTFLRITPPTATDQHKGYRIANMGGRMTVMTFMKARQRAAHDLYERELAKAVRDNPDGIGTTFTFGNGQPCRVEIDFLFPLPSSTPKARRNTTVPRITRPDADNMAKGLLDSITASGILQDDAFIYDLRIRKFNVPQGRQGVRITVTDELPQSYMTDGDGNITGHN